MTVTEFTTDRDGDVTLTVLGDGGYETVRMPRDLVVQLQQGYWFSGSDNWYETRPCGIHGCVNCPQCR